jgi:hypothetical protein
VPTRLDPIEGSIENDVVVTPETEVAVAEILRAVDRSDEDQVIEIAHFYSQSKTNGESEPESPPLVTLVSIT